MDRERKLLYTVALLAPILETLMFAAYIYHPDYAASAVLMEEVRDCEARLVRTYAACLPKLPPVPGKGI